MTRSEFIVDLFHQGYSCSQAVLRAYTEDLGLNPEAAMLMASSFGAGMGRLREVCGAVSAIFMVAGLKYGFSDPKDMAGKTAHYALLQELARRFEARNGSIICRELLGLPNKKDSPVPTARTESYYQKRPCAELAASAAIIFDQLEEELRMRDFRRIPSPALF